MRLILIANERGFASALTQHLTREGHAVDWFEHAHAHAIQPLVESNLYQCLLVDLGPADDAADTLLRATLERCRGLGTVVISHDIGADRRISLLELGVDDILVKPVDLREASARIRRVVRRTSDARESESDIHIGRLRVCAGRRQVSWCDKPVTLTNKEFGLLEVFLNSRGRVLSRSRLEDALYGMQTEIASNAVEVHIHHLRRKLARDVIVSVRNVGYQLGPGLMNG